ncbi:hypothetical protein HPB49_020033 [Dermacentor silvarum]|uniref:Uncharacterized protein n=1 Tax=Dermacentor silvarum TaxID=543639 RepID=A0ACB8CB67_DERSI|nr:hypothetical protein HPB49_020033 [Dermacentor silvarum]
MARRFRCSHSSAEASKTFHPCPAEAAPALALFSEQRPPANASLLCEHGNEIVARAPKRAGARLRALFPCIIQPAEPQDPMQPEVTPQETVTQTRSGRVHIDRLFTLAKRTSHRCPLLIVGDINSPHTAWGYPTDSPRGAGYGCLSADKQPYPAQSRHGAEIPPPLLAPITVSAETLLPSCPSPTAYLTLRGVRTSTIWVLITALSRFSYEQLKQADPLVVLASRTAHTLHIISDIATWSAQLQRNVPAMTHPLLEDCPAEAMDSHLLPLWEAKAGLEPSWRRQRWNRTLRCRLARLNNELEAHAPILSRRNWESLLFSRISPGDNPHYTCSPNDVLDQPKTEAEVMEELQCLSTSSAPAPGGVQNKAIRNLHSPSSTALTDYFNECWLRDTLPPLWKDAKVVIIPQSGKTLLPANICPMSFTFCAGNLMEHGLQTRLSRYLENSNLLRSGMFGFRPPPPGLPCG